MYDGIVVARRRGPALRIWPWWPTFTVVMVIPATTVETTDVRFAYNARDRKVYDEILDALEEGVTHRWVDAFLYAAKASALLNQRYVANPYFEDVHWWARRCGALGWNVAHTGSMIGLLFPPHPEGKAAARHARRWLSARLTKTDVRVARTAVPAASNRSGVAERQPIAGAANP